jgi:hypothetical protein
MHQDTHRSLQRRRRKTLVHDMPEDETPLFVSDLDGSQLPHSLVTVMVYDLNF